MTKRFFAVLALSVVLAGSALAASWDIDLAHSSVGFKVRHLIVSNTRGVFAKFSGEVEFDGKEITAGSAKMTIEVASLDTDDEKRDEHLKSPEFFDAAKFPQMTFVSRKVVAGKEGSFTLVGDLTIRDVTKEVSFHCEFHGIVEKDPWGMARAGFSAVTKIDRQDFNV